MLNALYLVGTCIWSIFAFSLLAYLYLLFSYSLNGRIAYLSATLRIKIFIILTSFLNSTLSVFILSNFKFTTIIRYPTDYPINSTLSVQTIIKLLYSFSDTYKLISKKICIVLLFVPIFVLTKRNRYENFKQHLNSK